MRVVHADFERQISLVPDEYCAAGERKLWKRVLLRALLDATTGRDCRGLERVRAIRWIGQRPSREFRDVCDLAGFDPDYVHDGLMRGQGVDLLD